MPELFAYLKRSQVKYVVLRWFEDLPAVAQGEDLDLLVADDHLPLVERVLSRTKRRNSIPIDLYSASGLPGTDFQGMAYYPPPLAHQILQHAIAHHSQARVPSTEDHFHSLAFHALYHKGFASGLPEDRNTDAVQLPTDHDYVGVLASLAAGLGYGVPITLNHLDTHLAGAGWRPPLDTLARLSHANEWLTHLNRRVRQEARKPTPGLCVFIIRERALIEGWTEDILVWIAEFGFSTLAVRTLDAAAKRSVASNVRGANWGAGPWPESGGDPAIAVATIDLLPVVPSHELLVQHPCADNERVFQCKEWLRERLSRRLQRSRRCNVIHSSDDAAQAVEYGTLCFGAEFDGILARAEVLRTELRTHEEVVRPLSRYGRRAKVEVVKFCDGLAVRKTFKPGFEAHAGREVYALRTLGQKYPHLIPPILSEADRSFVIPYYDGAQLMRQETPTILPDLLPLDLARQALSALQQFYECGFWVVDNGPDNILGLPDGGIRFIDFEFAYYTPGVDSSFEKLMDSPHREALSILSGNADMPIDFYSSQELYGYRTKWYPYVGLSIQSVLQDPVPIQHFKRIMFVPLYVSLQLLRIGRMRGRRIAGRALAKVVDWRSRLRTFLPSMPF